MLKRISSMLAAFFIFCIGSAALAEGGVNVEVIRADGVSVVVLTPAETVAEAESLAKGAAEESRRDFALPEHLTLIGEGAFEGISARRVEITANVVAVGAHAFADCKFLREIHIPATVLKVDDHALDGCRDVMVYGVKGTEAERFARAAGFAFVDPNGEPERPHERSAPPVELPLVPRK